MVSYRPADPYGIQRSLDIKGKSSLQLPQQALKLDTSLPLAEDELLIEVESLNIDSASFHQISSLYKGDIEKIKTHILKLVDEKGKHHNPVTGSGGMLIGKVIQIGPLFPIHEKPVQVGDRIATLVSLTLTPLSIQKIIAIHQDLDRVDIQGQAILFSSGIFARLPQDLPEAISLAILDVAGAPAQTAKLTKPNDTVVIIGGGGKSGVLCLYEAKKKKNVKTIAIDYSNSAIEKLKSLSFVDEVIQIDARNSIEVMNQVSKLTHGQMADLVINVANIPHTEMSCVLSCKKNGIVYFFSMSTSFTQAALGAEGVGADVDLRIGNGYTQGHADLSLQILRESSELRDLFIKTYTF